MNANNKQVGGEHYRSQAQHWDFVTKFQIGYLEACATKYITRWRKKNGLQDLEKAEHYVEKLLEVGCDPRSTAYLSDIEVFSELNELKPKEARLCAILFHNFNPVSLTTALGLIKELKDEAVDLQKPPVWKKTNGMQNPFGYRED